eukprot:5054853-Amphidinium_carterae.1
MAFAMARHMWRRSVLWHIARAGVNVSIGIRLRSRARLSLRRGVPDRRVGMHRTRRAPNTIEGKEKDKAQSRSYNDNEMEKKRTSRPPAADRAGEEATVR